MFHFKCLVQSLLGQSKQLLDTDYATYSHHLQDLAQTCRLTCQEMRKVSLAYISRVAGMNAAYPSQQQRQQAAVPQGARQAAGRADREGRLEAVSRLGAIPVRPKPPSSRHIVWRYPPTEADASERLQQPQRQRRYQLGEAGYAAPPPPQGAESTPSPQGTESPPLPEGTDLGPGSTGHHSSVAMAVDQRSFRPDSAQRLAETPRYRSARIIPQVSSEQSRRPLNAGSAGLFD